MLQGDFVESWNPSAKPRAGRVQRHHNVGQAIPVGGVGEGEEEGNLNLSHIDVAVMAAIEMVEENYEEERDDEIPTLNLKPESNVGVVGLEPLYTQVELDHHASMGGGSANLPPSNQSGGGGGSRGPRYLKHIGRACCECHSTESSSWLKDKSQEGGYNCLKCYQKKSRTGPVKDVLSDGSLIQRTCTRCAAQDTSRWHRDIVHDVEVHGVVRPAFICGKCKYKYRKSRDGATPIDGRTRRVDRKGGMIPYNAPASRLQRNNKRSNALDHIDFAEAGIDFHFDEIARPAEPPVHPFNVNFPTNQYL